MKKVVSAFMAVAILLTFTACSSKEYIDVPLTDENGQTVTDENGNTKVQKVLSTDASSAASDNTSSSNSDSSASSSDSSSTKKGETTSKKSNANSNNKTTSKANKATTSTTKATTTAKPKNRDVSITVELPYYNGTKTKLTLYYKVAGDKKYTELESRDVVLNSNNKKETFKIKDIKGDVSVYVELEDIKTTDNSIKIMSYEKSGKIKPVTGIEIMDGGFD